MHYVPLLINGVPLVGLALLEDDRWEDTALLDDINRGHIFAAILSTSPQPHSHLTHMCGSTCTCTEKKRLLHVESRLGARMLEQWKEEARRTHQPQR